MSQSPPPEMTAIAVAAPGGPEVLKPARLKTPETGPFEILVRVEAAGVNRADALQRQGRYPPPPGAPETLGLEASGEVAAIGSGVTRWRVGDKVAVLLAGGGYAEYCVAPEVCALPVPEGIACADAAALPEACFTVWDNVFTRGGLKAGERFLVHGGTSGIGTTAIQLAKAFGATVFATAGSDAKCDAMRALGADHAINYARENFVEVVKVVTEGRGVDVILDMVGGDYIPRNIDCLARDGRHVSIAVMKGAKATLDVVSVMTKRLVLTGSTLRGRSTAEKGRIAEILQARVWPLLARGAIRPVIDQTFPLAEASAAHALLESSAHIGKILLLPS